MLIASLCDSVDVTEVFTLLKNLPSAVVVFPFFYLLPHVYIAVNAKSGRPVAS